MIEKDVFVFFSIMLKTEKSFSTDMASVLESLALPPQDAADFKKLVQDLDRRVTSYGRVLFSQHYVPDLLVQVLGREAHTSTFSPQSFTPTARLAARVVRALDSLAAENLEEKLEGPELQEFRRLRYGSLDETALQTYACDGFPSGVFLGSGNVAEPLPSTECGSYELLFASFDVLFARAQRFIRMDDEWISAPLDGTLENGTRVRKKYAETLRLPAFTNLTLMVAAAARYLAQYEMLGSYKTILGDIRDKVRRFYEPDGRQHYRGDWDGILCNTLLSTLDAVLGEKESLQ